MVRKKNDSILLVANFSNKTGYAWNRIYKLYNSIAKGFSQENISVCVSFSELILPVSIFENNIDFTSVEYNVHDTSLRNLLRFMAIIKKENVRYIYFTDQSNWSVMYFLARLWGVKKIIMHLRIGGRDPNPIIGIKGWKKIAKTIKNQLAMFTPNKIYVTSDFVAQYAIRIGCYSRESVRRIYNGVKSDDFCPSTEILEDNSRINIVCCSRASSEKGIGVLINSVAILKFDYELPPFCVQFAGDGPDMEHFRKLVEQLKIGDVFCFLGNLDDTTKLICESDIVVIPSICGEAFSNVAAESMAAGKALVATNAGALPEVVGDCGIIVAHSDPKSLACALYDLAIDKTKREKIGQKAKARVKQYYEEKDYHRNVVDSLIEDMLEN